VKNELVVDPATRCTALAGRHSAGARGCRARHSRGIHTVVMRFHGRGAPQK